MTARTVIASFLGGAAAGALLGILMAPDSGVKTRRKIIVKAQNSKEALGQLLEDSKKSWLETRQKLTDEASATTSEIEQFVRHILEKGKSWWHEGKTQIEEVAEETADTLNDVMTDGPKMAREAADQGRAKVDQFKNRLS